MDEKNMEEMIAEAEREAAEAVARAAKAAPSDAVRRMADAQKAKREADEQTAVHKRTERVVRMNMKEAAVRKTLADGTLVKAVDLYELFPLGAEPASMPDAGFTILRNPEAHVTARKDAAVQTGDNTPHAIGVDLVVACVLYPTTGDDSVKFRAFLETHPEAVAQLVSEVRDLGGAKSRARPMGRG